MPPITSLSSCRLSLSLTQTLTHFTLRTQALNFDPAVCVCEGEEEEEGEEVHTEDKARMKLPRVVVVQVVRVGRIP